MRRVRQRLFTILLLVGAACALVGSVAPWVPHHAAGLRIGAFDLFEVVKYLPGVRSGEFSLFREGFLIPFLVAALLLTLVPVVRQRTPKAVRWALPLVAAIVAATALPPYPQIKTAYRDPEYQGQLLLSVGTLCLVLVSPLARRLPNRVKACLASILAIIGAVIPFAQFVRVRGLFVELYNAPVGIGWGAIVYIIGMVLTLTSAVFGFIIPDYECQE